MAHDMIKYLQLLYIIFLLLSPMVCCCHCCCCSCCLFRVLNVVVFGERLGLLIYLNYFNFIIIYLEIQSVNLTNNLTDLNNPMKPAGTLLFLDTNLYPEAESIAPVAER